MKYLLIIPAIALIIALYAAISYICFRMAIVRRKQKNYFDYQLEKTFYRPYAEDMYKGFSWLASQNAEELEIISSDGLRLRASLIRKECARGTVILFHGYRSLPELDFSCVLKTLSSLGMNLVLVNQRSHGKSEGKYIGFGIPERDDCLRWIDKVNEVLGSSLPLYIEGLSMGATTVMMAADADMPDNLCGIIADCGFTSPYEIISSVIKKDYHIPPLLIAPAINAWCRALAGFDLRSRSVTETLSRTSLPLLLIHGKADLFVPFSMGEAAYRACASSDKTFIAVDGAGHGESYFKDREAVTEAISSFFTRTSLHLSVR